LGVRDWDWSFPARRLDAVRGRILVVLLWRAQIGRTMMSPDMSGGFHRIHLRAPDQEYITLYLPLTEDGRLDTKGHQPWLCKALWGGFDYLGEFVAGSDGLNRIVWADEDEWLTDLGTVPVRKGAVVSVYEGDDAELADVVEVVVADVRRV
jgi:hypothetical protein